MVKKLNEINKNQLIVMHKCLEVIPATTEKLVKKTKLPRGILLMILQESPFFIPPINKDGIWELSEFGKQYLGNEFQTFKKREEQKKSKEKMSDISTITVDDTLYEEIFNDYDGAMFVYLNNNNIKYVDSIEDNNGKKYFPIDDDAIKEKAVLLPTEPEEFGGIKDLINDIRKFIKKYLDVSDKYVMFASYYIMMTWVYDKLNTVPYLRTLGDSGVGKSRFLDVIGRLCYKPCIVSGSITPAPIYRMIKRWGGTIILEEADMKDSSEKNEVVTILNCGFERGRPVIRCDTNDPSKLNFLPTFCPKVFATRFTFYDKALESRCLTEKMRPTNRVDIPPVLPKEFYDEQMTLRNKLLLFRLRFINYFDYNVTGEGFGNIEMRLKQTMSPFTIFSAIPELFDPLKEFLLKYNREIIDERATTMEGMIINAIHQLKFEKIIQDITVTDICNKIEDMYSIEKPDSRRVGRYLKSLNIKSHVTKVGGKAKRLLVLDDEIFLDTLYIKYIPDYTPKSIDGKNEEKEEEKGDDDELQ